MDNVQDILTKLKTYPNTYKELIFYFEQLLKKDKVEAIILTLKVSALTPHLIKFIELKQLNFLDALVYTNHHIFSLEYNYLMIKTIYVCFSKLEHNKPIDFDLF